MQVSREIAVERAFGPEFTQVHAETEMTDCECTCACVNQPAANMTSGYSSRQSQKSVSALEASAEDKSNTIGDMKALRWW